MSSTPGAFRVTIRDGIGQVRRRLGNPTTEHLTDEQIYQSFLDKNQYWMGELKNTEEGWFLQSFRLHITGGQIEYPIPAEAPAFEGSFAVVTDPANCGSRSEIEVVRYQDLDLVKCPDRLPEGQCGPNSVRAICFYGREKAFKAQVKPINARGELLVWYEPGFHLAPALDDRARLLDSQFPLLVTDVTIDVSALAHWADFPFGSKEEIAHRAELLKPVVKFNADLVSSFRRTTAEMNQPQISFRQPASMDPYGGGWGSGGGWW